MLIRPKYYDIQTAPMAYYKFITKFALILGFIVNFVNTFALLISNPYWVDAIYSISVLILNIFALLWLRRMEWKGAQALFCLYFISILYSAVFCIVSAIYGLDFSSFLSQSVANLIIAVPTWIYFKKRRMLFHPLPVYPSIPNESYQAQESDMLTFDHSETSSSNADADDKTADGSIADSSVSIEPKKPLFARYETYISCPNCGSLVPKGTKFCDCGYDLSGPVTRLGRCLRRAVPVFVAILLFVGGGIFGYYYGQESMKPELSAQFEAGQKIGQEAGYANGYKNGLSDGTADTEGNYKKVFEDAYRTALADNATGTYGRQNFAMESIRFDFPGRDALNAELAEQYGFTDATPSLPPPQIHYNPK